MCTRLQNAQCCLESQPQNLRRQNLEHRLALDRLNMPRLFRRHARELAPFLILELGLNITCHHAGAGKEAFSRQRLHADDLSFLDKYVDSAFSIHQATFDNPALRVTNKFDNLDRYRDHWNDYLTYRAIIPAAPLRPQQSVVLAMNGQNCG